MNVVWKIFSNYSKVYSKQIELFKYLVFLKNKYPFKFITKIVAKNQINKKIISIMAHVQELKTSLEHSIFIRQKLVDKYWPVKKKEQHVQANNGDRELKIPPHGNVILSDHSTSLLAYSVDMRNNYHRRGCHQNERQYHAVYYLNGWVNKHSYHSMWNTFTFV